MTGLKFEAFALANGSYLYCMGWYAL